MFQKGYEKICGFFSAKKIAIMGVVAFVLSLLPLCYLSFFNRATGDDYGYGARTHAAWMQSHSLGQLIKAACETVHHYYVSWQGTWFSIFAFSLHPEVFSNKAYVIVAFLMLFLWIGSTILLFRYVLRKLWNFSVWSASLIITLFLTISIQYIPSTASSIFWFNGTIHYMLPFTMCQVVLYCLLKYVENYKQKHLFVITLFMILLSGSNYQAALFALMVCFYIFAWHYFVERNRKDLLLLLPMILELPGLIISMKAPGNKIRGGEAFGFSIGHVLETIGNCFATGVQDMIKYMKQKPVIFILLLLILVFAVEAWKAAGVSTKLKHPLWFCLAALSICFAMHAPAIYAGVDVSGGVGNMNYQGFILMAFVVVICLAQKLATTGLFAGLSVEKLHAAFVCPMILVSFLLLCVFRSNIKDSTTYESIYYIISGQADDYKVQMDLQTEILENETVTDAVIPFVNNEQGPLMHIPVMDVTTKWSNTVTAAFYGKNTVVAIPRDEWEEKYQ